MANTAYDPENDDNQKGKGFGSNSPDSSGLKQAEQNSLYNPNGDKASSPEGETSGSAGSSSTKESLKSGEESAGNTDKSGNTGLYRDDGKHKNKRKFFGSKRRTGAIILGVAGIIGGGVTFFSGLSIFTLSNFMANAEIKGFGRYQVDLRGRSDEWLQAYMQLRFAEVEDKNLAPKDRNNLYFRSNQVSNNPVKNWFLELRGVKDVRDAVLGNTSNFEQDVFENNGIKFTSVAYQDGNQVKYRPGIMELTNTDEKLTFDPSQAAITAIQTGDPNAFNGELDKFINVTVLDNDKEGRQAIRNLLKDEYPGWWRGVKRWHIRQDIQSMTGIRRWSLFEEKRTAAHKKKTEVRNKVVQKVRDSTLPADSKSGKFVECLFGLSNCTASTDVANPSNRAYVPDGTTKSEKPADTDNDPNTPDAPISDGSADKKIQEAAAAATLSREAISKIFKGANLLSLVDAFAKFDKAMHEHKFTKLISQMKLQYVIGAYTTFKLADDHHKTGNLNSQEFGEFMSLYRGLGNGEGWTTVVEGKGSSGVSAASASSEFTPAKDKQEFCSEKHQQEMEAPENVAAAKKEYQYRCDKDAVNNTDGTIAVAQAAWNSGPGAVLHPILSAFDSVAGGLVGIINSVIGAASDAVLSLSGLSGTVEEVVGWGLGKAVEIGGANMDIGEDTPDGRVGNLVLEGAAGLGESTMRFQGGAVTTPETAASTTKNYIAYQQEQRANSSLFERYISTSNPQSLLSHTAASIGNMQASGTVAGITKLIGSIFTSPFKLVSVVAYADTGQISDDGYTAARWAGVETNDLPDECIKAKVLMMTPQSATNADEMGIFQPDELNWEMMADKTSWYDALYDKTDDENKAKKVWNCALIDNTAAGGMGAPYGYKGKGAFAGGGQSPDSDTSTPEQGEAATGNAQALAKQIIDSGKIKGDSRYMGQIKAISDGNFDCNVNPTILKMLASIAQDGHTLRITSLNRKCTGVLTASGVKSFHYASGGGHAVDIDQYDGKSVNGANKATVDYLTEASKYLPTNTGYGQVVSCNSGFKIPSGSYAVPDTCDHQHLQVLIKEAAN